MIAFDFNQPNIDVLFFKLLFADSSKYGIDFHFYRSDNSTYYVDSLGNEIESYYDVIDRFKKAAQTAVGYIYKDITYDANGTPVAYGARAVLPEGKDSKEHEFYLNPVWLIVGVGALLVFNLIKK